MVSYRMVSPRRAFTLIELLVVMVIILAVSALALPTILSATRDRASGNAARMLQGSLVGARDAAIGSGVPHGIRLVLDPSFPVSRLLNNTIDPTTALVAGSIVLTETPPDYTTGLANAYPGWNYTAITNLPCLVLEESPGTWVQPAVPGPWIYQPNEQANWWWNIRLGERITVKSQVLTVCGPMVIPPQGATIGGNFVANTELFTNAGAPGAVSPWSRVYTAPDGVTTATGFPQYLLLVNGKDDNHDGFIDNGWDGLDNDNVNGIDDLLEWETEFWPPTLLAGFSQAPYSIARRPAPSSGQQSLALPSSVVIDLTTWATTLERSRLPVNPFTGNVEIMIAPDGTAKPDLPYAAPSAIGMGQAFYHFWLTDRADVVDPQIVQGQALRLPIPPALKGSRALVSLQSRTGRLSTGPIEVFDPTDAGAPFRGAQQGQ